MESASKKRGRPSKFTDEEAAELRRRYPGVDERQRYNLFYAEKARSVLNSLIRRNTTDTDEGRAFIGKCEWILQRRGILTELGRILDKAKGEPGKPKDAEEMEEARRLFLRAVSWLAENKPNAKVAIGVLRRERNGGVKPADEEDLAYKVAMVVLDYGAVRPGVGSEFVVRALGKVPRTVNEILDAR